MLTLLDQNIVLEQTDYYIDHLASGLDELVFSISIYDPNYQYIKEEAQIKDRGEQIYLVKSIDAGKDEAKVKCQINVDDWKAEMFLNYTNKGDKTVYATINNTINSVRVRPSSWSVTDNSGSSIGRTVESEGATAMEILDLCRNIYNVTFNFNTKTKTLTILPADPNPASKGIYATRDLNLTEINYKGKSTKFATRIYPYGKGGLNIKAVNNNVEYLENTSYSNKVISVYWKDERYTIDDNLKLAAQAKLDQMAVPQSSYSCSVYDLAKALPSEYGFLEFQLFDKVTLLDDIRGTRVEHIIVEYKEYPYCPEKNVVTLSSVTPRIQSQVKELQFDLENVNSVYNVNQQIIMGETAKSATQWITTGGGGWVMLHRDEDGHPDELLITNKTDYMANDAHVWRWNKNGLGYSSTGYNGDFDQHVAITSDGKINATEIKTGKITSTNNKSELDMSTGKLTLNGSRGSLVFDGTDLTIKGAVTADSGEIGGFSIDGSGNLAGASSLKVGSMTLSGNTISGVSSLPALRVGGGQLDYGNFSGGTVYLLGMCNGTLQLLDLALQVVDPDASETQGSASAVYQIVPTSPGGSPPSPSPAGYATAVQITSQGNTVKLRTGPSTSSAIAATLSTGQIFGGSGGSTSTTTGDGYTWAVVQVQYIYNSGTGKYDANSLGGTYYIAQAGSSGAYWVSTQVQTS